MAKYKVSVYMVTGRASKVFRFGAEVRPEQFPAENFAKLVESKALVLIEGSEEEKEEAPIVTDNIPAEFKKFILEHSIDEVKAEFQKDLEAFPTEEWKDIDNHDDLIAYISGKMAIIAEKAKVALNVTEEESKELDKKEPEQPAAPAEDDKKSEGEDGKTDAPATNPAPAQPAEGNEADLSDLKDKLNGSAPAPEKAFDKTFDEWTVPEMKAKLDELKIEFESKALKPDLWELLKKG